MIATTAAGAADRREWWERRRVAFSCAVVAGYAASTLIYELFTPSWAGDHIGLSVPALIFGYGPMGLVCVALANAFYSLPLRFEPKDIGQVDAFRRRVFLLTIGLGAVLPLALFGAWLAVAGVWCRR